MAEAAQDLALPAARRTIAWRIARELGEHKWTPVRQIEKILEHAGEAFARDHVVRARAIDQEGGLFLERLGRRRTLGGIFFWLVKQTLGEEVWNTQIWPPRVVALEAPAIPARLPIEEDPATPLKRRHRRPRWSAAILLAHELDAIEPEEVMSVKLTLIGRPRRVMQGDGFVVATMRSEKPPPLPRGVPRPPRTTTRFTVYIGMRQWKRVEELLRASEEDRLIVEGFCVHAPDVGGIAVFATSVTTVGLMRERREAQRNESPVHGQ